MKIIDLLNKIANGEEPPKKIRLGRYLILEYDGEEYIEQTNKKPFLYYIWNLNEKVEILEEEKKIPEKLNYPHIEIESSADDEIRDYLYKVKDKFDEIIDYLKNKGE